MRPVDLQMEKCRQAGERQAANSTGVPTLADLGEQTSTTPPSGHYDRNLSTAGMLLRMQRTYGNRYVQGLIQAKPGLRLKDNRHAHESDQATEPVANVPPLSTTICSGEPVLAREATQPIQQGHGGAAAAKGVQTGGAPPIASSSGPRAIRRKEEVLAPGVTPANPLERLLNGDPDGLTTPFVNGIQISDTDKLDDALPSALNYSAGAAPDTCKVGKAIDVISQAKIIAATEPGAKGWTATVPLKTAQDVLGVNDQNCAAKKNIDVRMVAKIGNAAYAKLVRTAEGDHEAMVKALHKKYLKPYHDLVNSKVGSDKDLRKCAEGLSKDFRTAELAAIDGWAKEWTDSTDKWDGKGGPHTSKASVAVGANCNEVVVTINR